MPGFPRRGLCAVAIAALLAGCASNSAEKAAEAEAARVAAELAARTPPPITLNDSVAQAASVYLTFTRQMAAMEGGFANAEAIQTALQQGASYDPAQLSRGLVAYASILALQSPEFVAGVRQYAVDRTVRDELAANIASDPRWASTLPGSDAAAGLIIDGLRLDIDALGQAADSVENDAYTIQNRWDPRRAWAVAHVTNREARLQAAKDGATRAMLPSAEESARLMSAARTGQGLGVTGQRRREAPYPPVVERALALAALAALGAAGDNARMTTDALQNEPVSSGCLQESKLNLYQCLAASRPSYEDMFCVGRHVVRDIATCTRNSAQPAARVTVSNIVAAAPVTPPITVSPLVPSPAPVRTPVPTPAPTVTPAPALAPPASTVSPTERLNTSLGR